MILLQKLKQKLKVNGDSTIHLKQSNQLLFNKFLSFSSQLIIEILMRGRNTHKIS